MQDATGDVMAIMWGDVANNFVGQKGHNIRIQNSIAEYNTFSQRVVIKVNDLSAVEVNKIHIETLSYKI